MKADSDFYLALSIYQSLHELGLSESLKKSSYANANLSQFCTIQHQLTNAMQHYQQGNEKLRNTIK